MVGVGLAIVTVEVLARVKAINVNGWVTMLGCGAPGNGPVMRVACTGMFPGPGQRARGGHLLDNAGRPCRSAADRPPRLRHALPGRWACTQRSVLVADPRRLPEPVRPESAWSTSPSREPHQWALNPTGCRRPRTGSGSGCGSTGPAGSSSTTGIPSGHCSRGKRAVRVRQGPGLPRQRRTPVTCRPTRGVRRLRRSGRRSPRPEIYSSDWYTRLVLDERIALLDNGFGAGGGTRTPKPPVYKT